MSCGCCLKVFLGAFFWSFVLEIDFSTLFISLVSAFSALMTKIYFADKKTVFMRIDENKKKIESVKEKLAEEHYNKLDVEKYIDLLQRPIFEKMKHIDESLAEIKELLKRA